LSAVADSDAVLAWGMPRLRDLPWRATRDPWAVLVAEVMLQQTQAARVIRKWHAFLDAFPTPAACAAASLGDVLRLWRGLGYPRRARNLRDAAIVMVEGHGGAVPTELSDLLALPGVGSYTARAVRVFAFERDDGLVETNIARVLARTAGARLTPARAQDIADEWVPAGHGWVWNQVLIDLGAALCRPVPSCDDCPIAESCAWHRSGHAERDPAIGSAGVSVAQAPYDGSARQARGRVLHALGDGPVAAEQFPAAIVAGLVADRLVVADGSLLRLP
jgi:A/G-specific adenine glycosylase